MRSILLMILLATLLSCQSTPQQEYFNGEQCSPEFKVITDTDGSEWVDVKNSVCRCRPYHYGKDYVGPIRNPDGKVPVTRHHLSYCNLMKGYRVPVDTQFVNWLEWVRSQLQTVEPIFEKNK